LPAVTLNPPIRRAEKMAKPNYAFAKRQRDLNKKQKKEEKRQRKLGATETQPQTPQPPSPTDEKPGS
jgi:hypothetical protein